MKYYLYILFNKNIPKTYTGYTNNLDRRLREHERGEVKSTKKFKPFELVHLEEFETRKEAKERELYFKSYAGRIKLKKILNNQ